MMLTNKIAIITGAAGGIGEASSILFAREGAKVVAVDLKAEGVEATVAKVRAEGGVGLPVAADVTKVEDVKRIVELTLQEFGPPNVLFNNAGIDAERKLPLIAIPDDAFDRTVEVNLKGPFLMMKYVVPHMIEAGGGSIINTASISAFVVASSAGYSASKAGLIAMTRVAAVELGRYKIRVNALCPGATATPMAAEQRAEMTARGMPSAMEIIDRISVLGRVAEPMEQARMALFLASDYASFATGSPFIVDGGWTSIGGVETRV